MRRLLAAATLGAFVLVGCGQSDEEKAEKTAVAYFEAIGDGDYEDACGRTAEAFVEGFNAEPLSCEVVLEQIAGEGLRRLDSFDSSEATGNVDINGDAAEVQVESGGRTYTAHLEKDGDDWKVAGSDPSAPF